MSDRTYKIFHLVSGCGITVHMSVCVVREYIKLGIR